MEIEWIIAPPLIERKTELRRILRATIGNILFGRAWDISEGKRFLFFSMFLLRQA